MEDDSYGPYDTSYYGYNPAPIYGELYKITIASDSTYLTTLCFYRTKIVRCRY